MALTIDLSDLSEDELTSLIEKATGLIEMRRTELPRDGKTDPDISKGQNVRDPRHGVIPTPTPREVKEEARPAPSGEPEGR